ncbi:MAG: Gfo/Idh/MocA family oxidoreductase [Bacteroidales bacterium]|nr:Gfo/Idh/MocA family oxidoreductase [Bacteroidales bacterium]
MRKVITYGTYDLFHYGHQRLLERARALGDYLIVGVTADGFDRARGKINVQQSLMERMEAVKATGLADEVIVEEYEGQKIDDILRYGVDIFAIGSDWKGYFDYLKEYCEVVYLERTAGVSSSELRSENSELRLGLVGGELSFLDKFEKESRFVNGADVIGVFTTEEEMNSLSPTLRNLPVVTSDYDELLDRVDAVYIISKPQDHYNHIKTALNRGKHVLCESPIAINVAEWEELMDLAKKNNRILMDAIRTAYSTAYYRMLLLVKSGRIGNVVSVDASCSSLRDNDLNGEELAKVWNSICSWGPTALLPIFQILGVNYQFKQITSMIKDCPLKYDAFSKVAFTYPKAVASIKVGKGVKTEGELIISGTAGYIYVPAPWWKTDYFEIRREDPTLNKRYFYQLDGEGIRYEIVSFVKAIMNGKNYSYISDAVSKAFVGIIEDFYSGKDSIEIK